MATGGDSRGEVLAVLRAAARRLTGIRAVEAAAVGATAAGLCAAAGQAGVLAARQAPAVGIVLALAPVVAVAAIVRWPAIRSALRLGSREFAVVATCAAAASAAGVLVVLAGHLVPRPRILLPVLLVPLGAAIGAAGALMRRPSLAQAALVHDLRFGLAERLTTAAQLTGEPGDAQVAECVFSQATTAAREANIARRGLWRRTRATAGALTLAVALCATLALTSPPGSARAAADSIDEVRQRYRLLNPREKRQLVEALRQLARQVETDPALRRRLLAAAEAAAHDRQVESRLAELQQAVATADDAEAASIATEILRAIGLAPPGEGGGGPARPSVAANQTTDPNHPEIDLSSADANSSGEKPLAARTLVFNPQYAAIADANAPAAAVGKPRPFVPYEDAWSQAQARAAGALRTDTVPPRCRETVRRFFELK